MTDIWIGVAIFVALVIGSLVDYRVWAGRRAKFNEKFPPIDDEEFVRRCGPHVDPHIAIRVRRAVSQSLGIEYKQVYPEQSFVRDLDC